MKRVRMVFAALLVLAGSALSQDGSAAVQSKPVAKVFNPSGPAYVTVNKDVGGITWNWMPLSPSQPKLQIKQSGFGDFATYQLQATPPIKPMESFAIKGFDWSLWK